MPHFAAGSQRVYGDFRLILPESTHPQLKTQI